MNLGQPTSPAELPWERRGCVGQFPSRTSMGEMWVWGAVPLPNFHARDVGVGGSSPAELPWEGCGCRKRASRRGVSGQLPTNCPVCVCVYAGGNLHMKMASGARERERRGQSPLWRMSAGGGALGL
eukprot:362535-Chlamydomonas_euryale.AAC.7